MPVRGVQRQIQAQYVDPWFAQQSQRSPFGASGYELARVRLSNRVLWLCAT